MQKAGGANLLQNVLQRSYLCQGFTKFLGLYVASDAEVGMGWIDSNPGL